MKLKTAFVCLLSTLSAAGVSFAGTSRMDNEFFAFRRAPILAVKDGATWKKESAALMGVKNGKFTVDFEGVAWVPAPCKRAFVAALPTPRQGLLPQAKMPMRVSEADSGQALVLAGKGCDITVWLTGPTAADKTTWQGHLGLGAISIPGTPSVIFGLIEFRGLQVRKTTQFIIGADDV